LTNDPTDVARRKPLIDADWLQNYEAEIHKSIVAAEQHLAVPAGTISSIPNDPDFIAIVKMYAVIEPILNELIASRHPQGIFPTLPTPQTEVESYRTFVTALNVEGRTGKLRLAEGLGLLTENRIAFIRGVAQVRNRYAHNVKNMHRPLFDMLMEAQQNNARIVEHLTGITAPMSSSSPSESDLTDLSNFLKRFMYYRLANYLSEALNTLRPPPLPPESGLGILGKLSAKAAPANRE
jgi:hypothetical protein